MAAANPVFFRGYENDLQPQKLERGHYIAQQGVRVALVALPFLSLYAPIGRSLALGLGAVRTLFSSTDYHKATDISEARYALVRTGVCVAGLAGTFFAHPLGMIITTVQDLGIALASLKTSYLAGENDKVKEHIMESLTHASYLTLLLYGGVSVTALFFAGQVVTGLYHSRKEYTQGHYLEAGGHFLMALLRGAQFKQLAAPLKQEWKGPLEKLGTGSMYFAHYLNAPGRFVGSAIERVTRSWKYGQEGFQQTAAKELLYRVTLSAGALVALPFTLASFVAIPFNALAASLRGRLEFFSPVHPRAPKEPGSVLTVLDQNIAGQEGPFAPLTAGVTGPFESLSSGDTRMETLCADIEKLQKDVLLLQEVHGLNVQDYMAQELTRMGYHVVLDRGLGVVRNNSGLLIASFNPLEEVQFVDYPLEDRVGAARFTLQGALIAKISGIFFINTHMNYHTSDEAQAARERQFAHILPYLNSSTPVVLAGDLNFDTDFVKEGKTLLERAGCAFRNLIGGLFTCDNAGKEHLRGVIDVPEKDDGVIGNDHVRITDVSVTRRLDLSDHSQVTFEVAAAS